MLIQDQTKQPSNQSNTD